MTFEKLARAARRTALAAFAALALAVAAPTVALAAAGPVALDPGHGGNDPGATYENKQLGIDLKESTLNWKISHYAGERLGQLGIPYMYTVSEAEFMNPAVDCNAMLSRYTRTQRALAKNARAVVSFHINSVAGGVAQGAEVWSPNTSSSWNAFTRTEARAFTTDVLARLSAVGFSNRGYKTSTSGTYPDNSPADALGMVYYPRLNGTTGVLIENGFINNLKDARNLSNESFLRKVGYAAAEAIAKQWPNSYVKPAPSEVGGWVNDGKGYKYKVDGAFVTSAWRQISGQWFYFNAQGYRVTGWQDIEGKRYYFNASGVRQHDWVDVNGQRFYLGSDGVMRTGWVKVGNYRYWLRTSSEWGPVGSMGTGWLDEGGRRYWLRTSGEWGPVGSMGTGWLTYDGNRYWLDRETGAMATGWTDLDGQRFYLREETSPAGPRGAMAIGRTQVGGNTYYLRTTAEWGPVGSMGKGWLVEGGYTYYFRADGSMATGVETVKGKGYYFRTTAEWGPVGSQGKGWLEEGGRRRFFDRNEGVMATGWADVDGLRRYFDPAAGFAAQGWADIDGQRFYFNADGSMATGVVKVGNDYFYLRTTSEWGPVGSQGKGWLDLDGKRYFFDRTTGARVTGVREMDGKVYTFDASGALLSVTDKPADGSGQKPAEKPAEVKNGWYDASGNPSVQATPDSKQVYYQDGKEVYRRTTTTPIMGSSKLSRAAFVKNFASKIKANFKADVYKNKGAATPEAFAEATWDAAVSEGVKPEVLAAQIGNETGWLRFGGIVKPEQCNFGGLGALDGNAQGNCASFATVQEGLLAQAQHLKAYATKAPLNKPCVDPRYGLVNKGTAPLVEDLGWGSWASSPLYSRDLLSAMKAIGA